MTPSGREDERRNAPRRDRTESPADPRRAEDEVRQERGGRRSGTFSLTGGLMLPVVGLLVLALVVFGGVLLWRWYGDQTGGTSPFEDSVASEPLVRLTNGPGRVRIEGVGAAEAVEISAGRYARGSDPAAARKNASRVAVDVAREDSTLEISSDGGRRTGLDCAPRVHEGSKVESAAGDVELSVGSGDLVLRDLPVGVLEARVEAGGAELLGRFAGGGRLLVKMGSIAVKVPPEDVRELALEARVGEVWREGEAEAQGGE